MRTYLGQFLGGLEYYLGPRRGPLTIGASLAGAYFRTRPELEFADMHLHFLPYAPGETGYDLAKTSGFRLGFYPCRPKSRGHVRIVSPDMRAQPEILFDHLSHEDDVQTVMAGLRIAGRIAQAPALQKVGVRELATGARDADDTDLLAYIRETAATAFHYSGTARIGEDDMAVVDPQLRVRGVGRLRVIDASIMPTIASGNTNPPVVMIAEKGADLLKAG
ncbi:MAG: GMC family oxidoreductase [Sphingomonadaceae bacterium]